jgi:hypothetical protein
LKGGTLRKNFKTILTALAALSLLILTFAIYSCCEDCPVGPVQPKPYRGWLYALDYWSGWLYQIDLETDSVIDSIHHEMEGYSTGAFDVSSDGKYLAVSFTRTTPLARQLRIYNAQNLQLIIEMEGGGYPAFTGDQQKLIICGDNIEIFQVPGFALLYADEIGRSAQPVIIDSFIFLLQMQNWASGDSQFVAKYNYYVHELDTFIITDNEGNWFSYHQFNVSEDGRYLYFGGYSGSVPSSLNCYDLDTREFIFKHYVYSVNGAVELNPTADELYFTDPGYSSDYESPGTVFIYDSRSGAYEGGISLFGYTTDEEAFLPLYANGVAFTPDGNWAYVGTGNVFKAGGGIVVINAKDRQVKNIIWPDLDHYIRNMKIGPKL